MRRLEASSKGFFKKSLPKTRLFGPSALSHRVYKNFLNIKIIKIETGQTVFIFITDALKLGGEAALTSS
jgi:hypothetical protein